MRQPGRSSPIAECKGWPDNGSAREKMQLRGTGRSNAVVRTPYAEAQRSFRDVPRSTGCVCEVFSSLTHRWAIWVGGLVQLLFRPSA